MPLSEQLKMYASFHTQRATKITHYVGVPLIIFSLMILFGWIHLRVPTIFDLSFAWILSAALLIYYFFLDIALAAAATVFFVFFNIVASFISQPAVSWLGFKIFLVTFILGLLLQALGHLFEKQRPALTRNLSQALIAPLFLVAELLFTLGFKKNLQEKMRITS